MYVFRSRVSRICRMQLLLLAGVGGLSSLADEAQAGGMSAPGFTSGIQVYALYPVGFYYLNQTASSFSNPNGHAFQSNTNVFFMYYQSGWEIAGGTLSFVVAPSLYESSLSYGPVLFGLYNTYMGAQISWPTPIDGLRVGYRLSGYIPQGGEVAFNYGAIENRFGFTYGKDGISALGNFIFGTPVGADGSQNAPNYFIADFHLLKDFGKWTLGLVGHASSDLSSVLNGYRQSQVALGGLVGYNFGPVVVQVKLTHDVYERNYGASTTTVWTNVIVPLGDL